MYVRASITIENCFIVPVFILIFMSLVSITGYYHDRIITKEGAELAALRLEEVPESERVVADENMRQQLTAYIEEKTLFVKNIPVEITRENGAVNVLCGSVSAKTRENNPCTVIRGMRAAMEVVDR